MIGCTYSFRFLLRDSLNFALIRYIALDIDFESVLSFFAISVADNPEKYSTKERKSIIDKANMLTPAIMTKSNSRKEVSNEFMTILKALGIVAVCIVSISGGYFFKKK